MRTALYAVTIIALAGLLLFGGKSLLPAVVFPVFGIAVALASQIAFLYRYKVLG